VRSHSAKLSVTHVDTANAEAVEAAVNELREYPLIGVPLTRYVRKRVLTAFKYSILYVATPNEIIIVAIAPHKRRPGYWRKRLRSLHR